MNQAIANEKLEMITFLQMYITKQELYFYHDLYAHSPENRNRVIDAKDHLYQLYERFEDLDIEDWPFSMAEYAKAKKWVKLGKSCCSDEIPPEIIKLCDLDDIILKLCNFALMKNEKPEEWSLLNIIPVPKSDNLCDNYRGNSLS